jgi:hypothetical protein
VKSVDLTAIPSFQKICNLFLVLPCLLCVVPGASAGDVTGEGKATLTLNVPYTTLLYREKFRYTIRLRNHSKHALPVIVDPFKASGKQVFISMERGVTKYRGPWHVDGAPAGYGDRVYRVERDGNWELVAKKATAVLQPGQSVEWDGTQLDPLHFFIWDGLPKSIQAQVLIGPGQWVSSNVVPFKTVRRDMSRSPVVFDNVYLVGPKKVRKPAKGRRVAIGEKGYLFAGRQRPVGRICEIPKGATPKFEWNPVAAILTVRFPGADVPPVRYDYKRMRTVPSAPSSAPSSKGKGPTDGKGGTKAGE